MRFKVTALSRGQKADYFLLAVTVKKKHHSCEWRFFYALFELVSGLYPRTTRNNIHLVQFAEPSRRTALRAWLPFANYKPLRVLNVSFALFGLLLLYLDFSALVSIILQQAAELVKRNFEPLIFSLPRHAVQCRNFSNGKAPIIPHKYGVAFLIGKPQKSRFNIKP